MSDRAARLSELATDAGVDVLLVTEPVNVRWLTGFTGTSGIALVGPGVRRFITDFRYEQQSAEQLGDDWQREIASQELLKHLTAAIDGPLKVGFDDAHLAVKTHAALEAALPETVELAAAGGLVERLRLIKDADEIESIRAAARLADAALGEVLERGLVGRTERDVALDIEFTLRRLGADGISFPSIVATGPHAALPHAVPRDVEIESGTLCVIDWGAQLDGYASDCTRTFATGDLQPGDREIYDLVLAAQLESLAEVRAGVEGRAVDSVARDIITAAGHGEHFGHGLGHGVGAEVHEEPRLSQRSDSVLAAGNVVTVEPGVYVPGAVGVRIEDLVVVTPESHELLTSLPKALQTIS